MTESTEQMLTRVQASFDRQGMMTTLGVEVIPVEPGRVEMSLRHDDRFTQQHEEPCGHPFHERGHYWALCDRDCPRS